MFMDFFLGEAIVCFVAVVSLGSPIFAVTWLRATFAPWFGTALRLSVCCSSYLPLASATKALRHPPKPPAIFQLSLRLRQRSCWWGNAITFARCPDIGRVVVRVRFVGGAHSDKYVNAFEVLRPHLDRHAEDRFVALAFFSGLVSALRSRPIRPIQVVNGTGVRNRGTCCIVHVLL